MRAILILILALMQMACSTARAEEVPMPSPPDQPLTGPGGRDYAYRRVRVTSYGQGADRYWLFEPDENVSEPMPVVVFVHGLNAVNYGNTWLWIEHLVRKGNLVIFPQYQSGGWVDPRTFTDKAADAIREGLTRFNGDRHTQADKNRFAMVGHSLGGTILANLAARYEHYGLPKPLALMAVQPGDVKTDQGLAAFLPSIMEDHTTIGRGTLMLVIASEDDNIVGQSVAESIYKNTTAIDADDKDLLLIRADDHGRPALVADHFVPTAYVDARGNKVVDAYDYALWRWFDALTDAAYDDGKHRDFALGNTPQQRFMGRWSDGTPIRQVLVIDDPGE